MYACIRGRFCHAFKDSTGKEAALSNFGGETSVEIGSNLLFDRNKVLIQERTAG